MIFNSVVARSPLQRHFTNYIMHVLKFITKPSVIKVTIRVIALSLSLLLHLLSHSLARLTPTPLSSTHSEHLGQAEVRTSHWFAVGFTQGKPVASPCTSSPSAPTTTTRNLLSDTKTQTVSHIYNYIENQTQWVLWTSLTEKPKKSQFGSQRSIATFCPRHFTTSQNQNRKHFFWNSTLGWRPMLFSNLYQTGTSYHPDILTPSSDSNCYIYSTIYCLSRVAV